MDLIVVLIVCFVGLTLLSGAFKVLHFIWFMFTNKQPSDDQMDQEIAFLQGQNAAIQARQAAEDAHYIEAGRRSEEARHRTSQAPRAANPVRRPGPRAVPASRNSAGIPVACGACGASVLGQLPGDYCGRCAELIG